MTIFVVIFSVDLISKYVCEANLTEHTLMTAIPGLIDFYLTYNTGAAWSILSGKQVFLIVLTLIFIAFFVWFYIKEKNKTWLLNITYGFIFAGCFGNLYDRVFFGKVRDFIQFHFWQSFPTFNVADMALTCGAILFVIYMIVYYVNITKQAKTSNNFQKEEKKDE